MKSFQFSEGVIEPVGKLSQKGRKDLRRREADLILIIKIDICYPNVLIAEPCFKFINDDGAT